MENNQKEYFEKTAQPETQEANISSSSRPYLKNAHDDIPNTCPSTDLNFKFLEPRVVVIELEEDLLYRICHQDCSKWRTCSELIRELQIYLSTLEKEESDLDEEEGSSILEIDE